MSICWIIKKVQNLDGRHFLNNHVSSTPIFVTVNNIEILKQRLKK